MLGRRLVLIGLAAFAAGCEREPLDWICPALEPGALVVTEIRGAQSGTDSYGQWIELYNAGSAAVDAEGLRVNLRTLDGSGETRILVRTSLEIAAGSYVVLGQFDDGSAPEHVDHGYGSDAAGLYDSAAIDILACGELVDRVVYRDLPATGTRAYDGAMDPDALGNDDEQAWCDDTRSAGDPLPPGAPGTPGQGNSICP